MLDRAQIPTGPRQPKILFLVPGVALSFALGAGIGLLLELLDPVVLSTSHFEKIGAPSLLGSIHRAA